MLELPVDQPRDRLEVERPVGVKGVTRGVIAPRIAVGSAA